ncbi:MAG: outer membrane beta-barrel family protein, partial [Bacteroidia bacterium]
LLFFILVAVAFGLKAQKIAISGSVTDTIAKAPLQNALTIVTKLSDSTLVNYTRTDKQGRFRIKALPVDTYIVVISHPQFADQTLIIVGNDKQQELDFGKIVLPPKTNVLSEVVVYGYKDKVYYKGDTLMFTADSFKVKQNATVEDLLKKLPGVKVDAQGKITVQGKEVSQVLVDGDEFFGSDPTIATKNLNAKTIESVQVYEKKNEDTESKDETVKVMNLKLKDEAKRGYFGKLSGAGGADAANTRNFYESELLLNRFNNKRKFSIFELGANSPKQRLNWGDVWQYGLNNEMNSQTDDDGNTYYYGGNNNQAGGIPQTLKTGAYFNDRIGKKGKVNADYTFNQNELSTYSSTNTQYFLTDTTYRNAQSSSGKATNQIHNYNVKYTQDLDSLTDLTFKLKGSYTHSSGNTLNTSEYYSEDSTLTRQTLVTNTYTSNVYDVAPSLAVNRKFKKKDRTLYASYQFRTHQENVTGYLNSENDYFTPTDSTGIINQRKTSVNSKNDHEANIIYTEPLSKKIKLELSYNYIFSNSLQDKRTKDFSGTAYDIDNPTLTNNYNNLRQTHRGGLRFIYDVKKFRIAAGSKVRQVQQSSLNLTTNVKLSQIANAILPTANFRYRFSDNKNLSMDYSTSSQLPDLNQLQPVINNTDPNRITLGNPNLRPTFSQQFNLNFYSYKPISNRNIYAGANFNTTNNSIAYTTAYDSRGVATTQPVNVNGNYSAYAWFGGSIPVFKRWLSISPNLNANYSNNVNFINGQKNITKQAGITPELNLEHTSDVLTFEAGGNYSYNKPSSTISSASSQPYGSYQITGEVSIKIPKILTIETDAKYNKNTQRTNGYNISYVIWNASISRNFLKKENLIVSLEAYDILNQNISTNRQVLDNRIVDSKSQVIRQYFLARITYKFTSDKAKKEDDF